MSEKKQYFQKEILTESENKFQNYVPDHTASQVQFYSSPRAHGYSLPVFLVSSPGGEATQSKILKREKRKHASETNARTCKVNCCDCELN